MNRIRHIILSLTMAGLAASLTFMPNLKASVVEVATLAELTRKADRVFAGSVAEVSYEREPNVGVVTRVRFENMRWAKGPGTPSTTMTLRGGRLGNHSSSIEGIPRFEKGKRYILFTAEDMGSANNWFDPIFGLHQGVYEVTRTTGGKEVIRDYRARPVVDVIDGKAVVVGEPLGTDAKKGAIGPRRGKLLAGKERGTTGPRPHGRAVQVFDRPAPVDSLPEAAVRLGARARDGGWLVIPRDKDPGTRIQEADFLAEVRHAASR